MIRRQDPLHLETSVTAGPVLSRRAEFLVLHDCASPSLTWASISVPVFLDGVDESSRVISARAENWRLRMSAKGSVLPERDLPSPPVVDVSLWVVFESGMVVRVTFVGWCER